MFIILMVVNDNGDTLFLYRLQKDYRLEIISQLKGKITLLWINWATLKKKKLCGNINRLMW